jgi:formylglycine-generating enzyme
METTSVPLLAAQGIEIELREIPPGLLLLGSASGRDDERPVSSVPMAAFRLGRTQVTNGQYDRFVAAAGHEPAAFRGRSEFAAPDQPVVGVSWFDATDFCAWLSTETGRPVRLPTEAEWEWAARGGLAGARHPWGDLSPAARYPDYGSLWLSGPERAGLHLSNAYGLCEMCENVHEWCADWYDPETRSRRSSRGGSWRHQLKVSTCSARSSIPPALRYADYGFRVTEVTPDPETGC